MKPSVLVIATLSALLSACGGGEDNAPLAIPDYRVDVTLPTAGTLCADLDQNWQCDPADPAVSGEGVVALVSRSANIVNSPLLFVPGSGGLLLAHPAAKGIHNGYNRPCSAPCCRAALPKGWPPTAH